MHRLAPLLCALACGVASGQALRDPLIGTVTTPSGRPVAGVTVEVWRAGGRGTNLLDLAYKNEFERIGVTPTDRRGRFALQLPVGLSCRVVIDHPPHAVWLRDDCLPGEELTIALAEPAVFRGTLTTADGRPATARLRAWSRTTRDEAFRGRTDARGRFLFDRVPPGPIRVEIAPDTARAPGWFDVELRSGQEYTHDVELAKGSRLFGRVTDRATGEPIAGARIGESWTMFRAVETDGDGRYELPGFGTPGRIDVQVQADGYVRRTVPRPDPLADAVQLDLQLRRGQATIGRVVDGQGQALADVYVQAFGFVADSPSGEHDCVAARSDATGGFALRGLHPEVDHVLVVKKDGFAMLVYALADADEQGIKQVGELVLPEARVVRGVFTDGAGEPIPHAAVALHGYNADRDRFLERAGQDGERLWRRLELYVGRRRSRTDHLGRFAFGDVPVGRFHVEAHDDRFRPLATSEPFEVCANADPKAIELQLDR